MGSITQKHNFAVIIVPLKLAKFAQDFFDEEKKVLRKNLSTFFYSL